MDNIVRTACGPTAVYDNGIKDGLPILYLHGGPGTSDPSKIFGICVPYPVITYDQYGCGESWHASDPDEYSLDMFIEQLREMILRLGLDKTGFVLCGSSWGSFLACAYIGKYGTECMKGLALMSPFLDDTHWSRRMDILISELPDQFRKEILRCRSENLLGEELAAACRPLYSEHLARNGPDFIADTDFLSKEELYRVMFGPVETISNGKINGLSVSENLRGLDIPAMMVCGEEDITGSDMMMEYAESMPRCKCIILEDTGHLIDRRTFGKTLTSFMDGLSEKDETPHRYLAENGYDIVLDPSDVMDTPDHEHDKAKSMGLYECVAMGRRHEKGDGTYKSPYSALIYYLEAAEHLRRPYREAAEGPGMEAYGTQYDRRDPDRHLVISDRGFETKCCRDLDSILGECTVENDDGSMFIRWNRKVYGDGKIKDVVQDMCECPFCRCRLETTKTNDDILESLSYGKDPESLLEIGKEYVSRGDIESCLIAKALFEKALDECVPVWLIEAIYDCRSKADDIERGFLKNITGELIRSSVCFESICCNEFAKNYERIEGDSPDRFYDDVVLGDRTYSDLRACPYCGARIKRTPRHC